jgi:adenylate cyclase
LECAKAGNAVNLVRRLEALARSMEEIAVCSRQIAVFFPADTIRPGSDFMLLRVPTKQTIYTLILPHTYFEE